MVTRARPLILRRIMSQVRALDWSPARRATVAALLAVAGLLARHGLVVAGLLAFVVAAAMVAPVLAWVVSGVSLLFLEVRRR